MERSKLLWIFSDAFEEADRRPNHIHCVDHAASNVGEVVAVQIALFLVEVLHIIVGRMPVGSVADGKAETNKEELFITLNDKKPTKITQQKII